MSNRLSTVGYFVKKRYFTNTGSRKKIEKRQKIKIKKQLEFIRSNSLFYGKIMNENTTLTDLPVMDKTSMMENFNTLNTVGIDRDTALSMAIDAEKTRDFSEKYGNITVGLSSGTSGNRGMFIVSEEDKSAWAGSVLAKLLPRKNIFGHRVALFLRANSQMYESIDSKVIRFRYFDIIKPIESHIDALNSYRPTIIAAPPSVLNQLIPFIESGELLKTAVKVISVAEVLERGDEQRIKKAFGISTVHQIYQCTEGFLGYTCHCGGFHINEDIVHIEKEYLDDTRFIPIITDFTRRAQPIIRYRLNDILIEDKEPCPCGSKMLKISAIEGRSDDIFLFPSTIGGKNVPVYSDFIRRCVLFSGIGDEYRVVQHSDSLVELQLVGSRDIVPFTKELEKLSKELGFVMPEVCLGKYTLEKGKKLKRVERKIH